MYVVSGLRTATGEMCEGLRYETLEEAMTKLRDLVEADEIDTDGPMFTEYVLRIDPLPRSEHDEAPGLRIARG